MKKIVILISFIFLSTAVFAQTCCNPLSDNFKKDISPYRKWYGESYIDSLYSYEGLISLYKRKQSDFLNTGLNIYYLCLSEDCSLNRGYSKNKVIRRKNVYKIPASVGILELWGVKLPLSFDLKINKQTLKQLSIYDGMLEKKDSICLDFSDLDSLYSLTLGYYKDQKLSHIDICFPPNLRVFGTNIPASYISCLPETIEELYIRKDSIYSFSVLSLPNLWLISFFGKETHPLPEELIRQSSLRNIIIEDTLTNMDIEVLAKIPHLDTLSLIWYKKNLYPDNLSKLTNVSVIKLDFNLAVMWYWPLRISIACDIQQILPNAIILYKDVQYDYANNAGRIEKFIKYEDRKNE